MTSEYTLYHVPGSSSQVSLIALEESGACYELHHVDEVDGQGPEHSHVELNKRRCVPMLRGPKGLISENIAIVLYLAQRHPKARMLPSYNLYTQSKALSIMSWCGTALDATLTRMPPQLPGGLAFADQRLRQMAIEELDAHLLVAEQYLAEGPWLLGATWSMADAFLFWAWSRAREAVPMQAKFPRLVEHAARMRARPSTQRALENEWLVAA
jgi:glutathione S-transferase